MDRRTEGATGELSIMGSTGDSKHYWNKSKWEEVEAAKGVFDLYKGKGFRPYKMNDKGDAGEPMEEFDPSVGSILFTTQMRGG